MAKITLTPGEIETLLLALRASYDYGEDDGFSLAPKGWNKKIEKLSQKLKQSI